MCDHYSMATIVCVATVLLSTLIDDTRGAPVDTAAAFDQLEDFGFDLELPLVIKNLEVSNRNINA